MVVLKVSGFCLYQGRFLPAVPLFFFFWRPSDCLAFLESGFFPALRPFFFHPVSTFPVTSWRVGYAFSLRGRRGFYLLFPNPPLFSVFVLI